MKGIPPKLNKRLINILIECGPFESQQELAAIFVDQRISAFAHSLPESTSRLGRANNLILHLHNRYDKENRNALVLFLSVLFDQTPEQTACYQKISQLISSLEKEVEKQRLPPDYSHPVSDDSPIEHNLLQKNRDSYESAEIYEILSNRFNEEELKTLCLYLDVEFDDLASENFSGKARELVKYLNRRERLHHLVSEIKRIRPDISF
jgi:hypothetical protein